jgi:30S ribosomal protein S31
MGKGDKKSRRGKIHIGSYGTRRPRKVSISVPGKQVPAVVAKTPKVAEEKAGKVAESLEIATEAPVEAKKAVRKTTKKVKDTE